jgi:hypothetical protein
MTTVQQIQKDNCYFENGAHLSSGRQQFFDDPIPRSASPDCLEQEEETSTHPHDSSKCPSLSQRGRGSNDTISSAASSTITTPTSSPSTPVPPELSKLTSPIPVKKPTKRLSNVFNNGFFGSLKMTPASPSSISSSPENNHGRRPSSSGGSIHSSSSVSSTASKFGKSFSRMMNSSFTLKKPPQDMTCGSLGVVPLLSEKYGDYVKPEHRSTKGMGSTSKKNIASGATAVIRLVRQRAGGRILAVKEFKKRDKSEAEREYQKRMLNEYCISKSASNHPHIVETLDLVKDEKARWCVVMEYVSLLS